MPIGLQNYIITHINMYAKLICQAVRGICTFQMITLFKVSLYNDKADEKELRKNILWL